MYSESKVNLLPQLLSVLPSFVLLMTLLCPSNAIQVVSFETFAGHVDKPTLQKIIYKITTQECGLLMKLIIVVEELIVVVEVLIAVVEVLIAVV